MKLLSLRLLYIGHQKESVKGADQKTIWRRYVEEDLQQNWTSSCRSTIEKAAKDWLEWKSRFFALAGAMRMTNWLNYQVHCCLCGYLSVFCLDCLRQKAWEGSESILTPVITLTVNRQRTKQKEMCGLLLANFFLLQYIFYFTLLFIILVSHSNPFREAQLLTSSSSFTSFCFTDQSELSEESQTISA